MHNNNFFNWGYPKFDDEYQIAFWEPVLNRFLLVMCNSAIVNDLRLIASSRYLLFACDVSTASNYSPNIIDNSCCEQWTLSNKKDIRFSKFSLYDRIVKVETLIPVTATADWDIDQEKQWLLTVRYWLQFLYDLKASKGNWYFCNNFIKKLEYFDTHQVDYYDQIDLVERKIHKALHQGSCVDSVCCDIYSIIDTADHSINNFWKQWKQREQ